MVKKLIRIILFLLFLEIFLRIGGLVSLRIQDYQNHFDADDKQSYCILCVGESITMTGGEESYPRELEKALNQKHLSKKFQVINRGIAGTTSTTTLDAMEPLLNQYKPDMVIAMMGLNDFTYDPFFVEKNESRNSFFKRNKFIDNLRIIKLLRGIYKNLKTTLVQYFSYLGPKENQNKTIQRKETIYDERMSYDQGASDENTAKAFQLGLLSILKKDYANAEEIFRILGEAPKAKIYNSKSTFYHYLAIVLYEESKIPELMLALEKVPFWKWYDIPVVDLCSNPSNAQTVINSLKNLHTEFPNVIFYSEIIHKCYEKSGNIQEANLWKKKTNRLREIQNSPQTEMNHVKLANLLNKKNIKAVFMQYPLRNVESLKSMLQSAPEYEKIIFIDNENLFKEAVLHEGYAAIFSDYVAGDFGHPTTKGIKILAEHIAETLTSALHWK